MVMEVLSGGIVEYLSVELKVRQLWSQTGRNDVRLKQRNELCDGLPWWQNGKHDFCGRLIVLACFTSKSGYDKLELYGDLCMNNEGKWRSLFGWPHAIETFDFLSSSAVPPASASPSTSAQRRDTHGQTTAVAKAKAGPSNTSASKQARAIR